MQYLSLFSSDFVHGWPCPLVPVPCPRWRESPCPPWRDPLTGDGWRGNSQGGHQQDTEAQKEGRYLVYLLYMYMKIHYTYTLYYNDVMWIKGKKILLLLVFFLLLLLLLGWSPAPRLGHTCLGGSGDGRGQPLPQEGHHRVQGLHWDDHQGTGCRESKGQRLWRHHHQRRPKGEYRRFAFLTCLYLLEICINWPLTHCDLHNVPYFF